MFGVEVGYTLAVVRFATTCGWQREPSCRRASTSCKAGGGPAAPSSACMVAAEHALRLNGIKTVPPQNLCCLGSGSDCAGSAGRAGPRQEGTVGEASASHRPPISSAKTTRRRQAPAAVFFGVRVPPFPFCRVAESSTWADVCLSMRLTSVASTANCVSCHRGRHTASMRRASWSSELRMQINRQKTPKKIYPSQTCQQT